LALNISEPNQSLSGQLNHLPKSDNGQHIALWCCTVTMLVNGDFQESCHSWAAIQTA
jgi:hypothetical protein